ncbi:hypothetical protein CPB84DRAFT_1820711 [Gymnopilus junonius]|uniref:Uncharacterized protein n=1 Tax=Gymnopilus junonius TaxID=109634 RepID=A0A9P5P0W3_GYMJU|nr:hypothetical protein CPB84DRAFT_1820711 [Gymnopilus junonius]
MANDTSAQPLPNPHTPMAFLPPELAYQVTISIYILVGSLGVLIWDVLSNLYNDYILLTKYRITIPTIAYVSSRIFALAHVLVGTIYETAPIGTCVHNEKRINWVYALAIIFSASLFFFRVRAICDGNKWVVAFFAFMWIAVVAGMLTVTTGISGGEIGDTKYCLVLKVESYVGAASIIPLVNDTLVFLAITYRLVTNSHMEYTLKDGFRTLVFGDCLPAFSRALLQDGQRYYFTTVVFSLLTVIMLYIPGLPGAYRTMFTVPNLVVMNIMACRVFRNTKFGLFRESIVPGIRSRCEDDKSGGSVLPFSTAERRHPVSGRTTFMEMDGPIEVRKTVECISDYPKEDKFERAGSSESAVGECSRSPT